MALYQYINQQVEPSNGWCTVETHNQYMALYQYINQQVEPSNGWCTVETHNQYMALYQYINKWNQVTVGVLLRPE